MNMKVVIRCSHCLQYKIGDMVVETIAIAHDGPVKVNNEELGICKCCGCDKLDVAFVMKEDKR